MSRSPDFFLLFKVHPRDIYDLKETYLHDYYPKYNVPVHIIIVQ